VFLVQIIPLQQKIPGHFNILSMVDIDYLAEFKGFKIKLLCNELLLEIPHPVHPISNGSF
jgi:hypothetical protein